MHAADLLTADEICSRRGFWARDWQRARLSAVDMLRQAVLSGLTETEREDYGEVAGEAVMELSVERGMETPASRNLHDSVCHHAALADTLTCAVRRPGAPAWALPPPVGFAGVPWASSALLDPSGARLRRLAMVSAWSDDRHYAEIRSWYGLGEVAAYQIPMTMVVLVLGQHRDGRRHGPWGKGFRHPMNKKLRFRKKSRSSSEVFSEKWEQIWREHHAEITNEQWLQAMMDDDILRDVCFPVEIPVPSAHEMRRIREMAARKLERILRTKQIPEASLSVCDRPRCTFLDVCSAGGPTTGAFVHITDS